MARNKNALRKHFIQDWRAETEKPGDEWLRLSRYISDISDASDEQTSDEAFYSGDGTPERTVTSVAEAYDVTGQYDPKDEAQALVAEKKRKIGDGRKVWHKIVESDGTKEWVGPATLSNIVAGAGPAEEFEQFSCNIRYDRIPEGSDVTNGGGGSGE